MIILFSKIVIINHIIYRIENVLIDTEELPIKQFLNWCQHYQNSYNGSDSWYEASAINLDTYKTCPGYCSISWKSKGYSTIIDLLQVYICIYLNSNARYLNV